VRPPSPDAKFAGTVSLQAVVSDKGYVCSVELIRGFDKTADKQAMGAVRRWHFEPAHKDGHPVPVVVETQVSFWRNASGELVQGGLSRSPK
jgi:TonB family protein